ncbi:uncharacterized protein M421DRAFT_398728 [Didymella exigua CBS 183.55]|uniref:Uncharacterized protein n=1 Tax=Didymella exigua CBS 183.55 TaxID=1150837 RepID=A0A6A5REE0_9PLEO|nr:uncharacterized protein M421DRAFT_398728 [Didymella exigua CBS 183.55]KAF1925474.1 hypothetical protein M421DRAFT_398728 [Didymella exigua CBS 183.55]
MKICAPAKQENGHHQLNVLTSVTAQSYDVLIDVEISLSREAAIIPGRSTSRRQLYGIIQTPIGAPLACLFAEHTQCTSTAATWASHPLLVPVAASRQGSCAQGDPLQCAPACALLSSHLEPQDQSPATNILCHRPYRPPFPDLYCRYGHRAPRTRRGHDSGDRLVPLSPSFRANKRAPVASLRHEYQRQESPGICAQMNRVKTFERCARREVIASSRSAPPLVSAQFIRRPASSNQRQNLTLPRVIARKSANLMSIRWPIALQIAEFGSLDGSRNGLNSARFTLTDHEGKRRYLGATPGARLEGYYSELGGQC